MVEFISISDFYKHIIGPNPQLAHFLDSNGKSDIGNFSVFRIADLHKPAGQRSVAMPYSRRDYYKISLINGHNVVEYADRKLVVSNYAVLFATPRIPYYYHPQDNQQQGHFCVFTNDFMPRAKTGWQLDDLPVFRPDSDFVFEISAQQYGAFETIFEKMHHELVSDYALKYDLLRNYVLELIHNGQKLTPVKPVQHDANAANRLSALFIELIERQFPIESVRQTIVLRTPKDYADRLGIHVNHLNKVLKETTGRTTTDIIAARLAQEAKILLRHTTWNVSEIALCLGFEEVAHFSNFFKRQTTLSPMVFRTNHRP